MYDNDCIIVTTRSGSLATLCKVVGCLVRKFKSEHEYRCALRVSSRNLVWGGGGGGGGSSEMTMMQSKLVPSW